MKELLSDFFHFLNRSPTAYHAAKEIANRLVQDGFTPLLEKDRWSLERGKGYLVVRDDAALIAFRMPKGPMKKSIILASHLDSPCLKLKPIPDILDREHSQFLTEVYGSPILHTWFDRNLALAGRIIIETENQKFEDHIVFLDDHPIISLPSRSINFR